MDYFKLKVKEGEVGSSAMPHKVNPIDFENAEGNCGIAVALFDHLANKLPISRLQRDLSDSTVLRNVGVPVGHSILAFVYLNNGLKKVDLNAERLHHDLEEHWVVVSEAIQTVLRREGYPNPYEIIKKHTRGQQISQSTIALIIADLDVSPSVKEELSQITPFNFIGVLPPFNPSNRQ
jgi:adenylosuccinate lyase